MRHFATTIVWGAVILLGSYLTAYPAQNSDKYYMVVFASQGEPVIPRTAHTFATFVRVSERPKAGDGAGSPVTAHTISWLPASLEIVPARPAPEKGKNLDLPATLKWAKSGKARIVAWGPYEIKKELFDKALQQIDRLNSGRIAYKALDLRYRGGGASNCIHAVSDVDTEGGLLQTGTAFGEAASERVVRHLRRWIADAPKTHAKIAAELKLAEFEVRFLELAEPGPATGTP